MIGTAGAMVSFEEGHELLHELADVDVTAKQVDLGMDGAGVPLRPSELRDRLGKQLDGSSKTREVKSCTVWSAESRDAKGFEREMPDR